MARKIIKAALFVLAAVVVAGGIMTYLRSQKKPVPQAPVAEPVKPATPEAPQVSLIQDISITPVGGNNAQVVIKGVRSRDYQIQNLDNEPGFRIQIPYTQAQQIQRVMEKPHPLIEKIDVHPLPNRLDTAEVVFYTKKNVNFLDSQLNDTLTIDFTQGQGDAGTATTASEIVPLEEKKKEAPVTTKKPTTSTKSTTKTAAKKPAPKKTTTVKAKPKAEPKFVDDVDFGNTPVIEEDFANNIPSKPAAAPQPTTPDFTALGGNKPTTESIAQPEEVPMVDTTTQPKPEADDGFNLDNVVNSDDVPQVVTPPTPTNLLDAETQLSMKENSGAPTQVAVAPQDQKFDLNQIKANLPALQNITVQKSGVNTLVAFDREKSTIQYKFFKMVNPSRIVVDFLNAKNLLKAEYPRFSGTKVSRVETREYASGDGTLIRVILYVDGAPNFASSKKGNQLLVEVK